MKYGTFDDARFTSQPFGRAKSKNNSLTKYAVTLKLQFLTSTIYQFEPLLSD